MANNIGSTSQDTLPPTPAMTEKDEREDLPQTLSHCLDSDGPDDPDLPLNWPKSKKWTNIMIVSILTLLTYVLSSRLPSLPHFADAYPSQQPLCIIHDRTSNPAHHGRNARNESQHRLLHGINLPPRLCLRSSLPRPAQRDLRSTPHIPHLHGHFPAYKHRMRSVGQHAYAYNLPSPNRLGRRVSVDYWSCKRRRLFFSAGAWSSYGYLEHACFAGPESWTCCWCVCLERSGMEMELLASHYHGKEICS